jgi:hypothetical protein
VPLFFGDSVRRFVGLAVLLFFAIPFGMSVTGCGHKAAAVQYCNAGDSGPVVGQVASITLAPSLATTGESLNYAQIGQGLSASAIDCKGNSVSVRSYVYASTSSFNVNQPGGPIFADINPSNGQVCGGTWNRNVGGGIPDYTTCTAPTSTPNAYLAFVTATADGAVSNAIPVYVHPVVTGIVLGNATPGALNGSCPAGTSDPGTDCCPNSTVGTPIVAPVYTGTGCISQNTHGQFVARVYKGGTVTPANNITCQVGHVSYGAVSGSGIVSIDQNGVATANQPGSTEITATLSNSSSSTQAGFFSTCPPTSIALSVPGSPTSNSVSVNVNNTQPFNVTVMDKNNITITGLSLEYNSTAQQNIPTGAGTVTPAFPGSAVITAVCLPASCNTAPFNQIGLYGNGEPLTSNGITVNTAGTSSTVLYMASAADARTGSPGSQYIVPYDFTLNQPNSPIKLAYVPNSMVINLSGSTIYLGSPQGLMEVATANNSATVPNQNIPGTVLSVSPDGTQLVVTDPVRQTISLISASSGAVETTYGGVATTAVWTPDSELVYITTQVSTSYPIPTLLQYSPFTKWQPIVTGEVYTSAAVTVPNVGAYFSGAAYTEGRSYCTTGNITSAGPPPVVTSNFAPVTDRQTLTDDVMAATTDGAHILGAHAVAGAGNTIVNDLQVVLPAGTSGQPGTQACPLPGALAPVFASSRFNKTLAGVSATAVTGVYPSTNSVVAPITYIGTGGVLPVYYPASGSFGNLINVPLSGSATAPLAGVFSTDSLTFFTGTATDNLVHLIKFTYPVGGGAPTATDSSTLPPNLPIYNGNGTTFAPVNLLVQYPKRTKI